MNLKQKRIIAALAAAVVLVIVALVLSVTLSLQNLSPTSESVSPGGIPTPVASPVRASETLTLTDTLVSVCRFKAAQLLSQAGLAGMAKLTPGGPLRFEITYPLESGETADQAAQSIWLVFDVALALVEEECDSFTQVEVVVLAQGNQTITRISARVDTVDLVAFGAGELSEDEFTRRVVYRVGDE